MTRAAILFAILVFGICSAPTQASVIPVDFAGSVAGDFTGLGTGNATWSGGVVSIETVWGGSVDFNLSVTIDTGGGVVDFTGGAGLGVDDISIEEGESMTVTVGLTPVGTGSITSLQLFADVHGTVNDGIDAADGVLVLDETGIAGELTAGDDLAGTSGVFFTLLPNDNDGSGALLGSADMVSVEGLLGFSFDAVAVPEPSMAGLVGASGLLLCLRRRRNEKHACQS